MTSPWDNATIDDIPIGVEVRGSFNKETVFRVVRGRQDRMDYYTPTNPRTPAQQSQRALFRQAIRSWQALSDEEQGQWNAAAKGTRRRGFDLYMSTYLTTHAYTGQPAEVGASIVGGDDYIAATTPAVVGTSYVGDSTVITT